LVPLAARHCIFLSKIYS